MSMRSLSYLMLFTVGLQFGSGQAQAVLTAHYSFDTNFNDVSGNGRHGIAVDGNGDADTAGVSITNTAGQFKFGGGAANFAEERDFIDIPTQTFGSGNPYSVAFWARDLSGPGNNGGMVIGQSGTTNFFIWLKNDDFLLRWRSLDSSTARQADFSSGLGTDWHHYALIASDADSDSSVDDISLYVDGILVGTQFNKLTGFIFDSIGEAYSTALNVDFNGQIDELYIYDEAITAEQVRALFVSNGAAAVPEPATASLALLAVGGMMMRRRRMA